MPKPTKTTTDKPPREPTTVGAATNEKMGAILAQALVKSASNVSIERRLEVTHAIATDTKRIRNEAVEAALAVALPTEWQADQARAELAKLPIKQKRLVLALGAAMYVQGMADSRAARK